MNIYVWSYWPLFFSDLKKIEDVINRNSTDKNIKIIRSDVVIRIHTMTPPLVWVFKNYFHFVYLSKKYEAIEIKVHNWFIFIITFFDFGSSLGTKHLHPAALPKMPLR